MGVALEDGEGVRLLKLRSEVLVLVVVALVSTVELKGNEVGVARALILGEAVDREVTGDLSARS